MAGIKTKSDAGFKCPFCDGTYGYYYKAVVSHRVYLYWDGTNSHSPEPEPVSGMKNRYCGDCNRDVTKRISPPVAEFQQRML